MTDKTNHVADKVIIITGAGGGFGRLTSEKCAALGGRIVCADIDEQALGATVSTLRSAGHEAVAVVTDVTRLDQTMALAQTAISTFGQIDVLVNNAGIMPLAFFSDHVDAMAAWDRCIDINIKGVLHGIVAVHDQMIAQGRGHVVNLSSIYSNHPVAGAAVYGASKAAVNFLSESLRVESQGRIKVTNVRPTGVPATGLGSGIVNQTAVVGILGQNAPAYLQQMFAHQTGELPAQCSDVDNMEYFALEPEYLADQIVYAINQPWGVSIGDITVRASGDGYIL